MSDLPPPTSSLRTTLSIHALIAAAIVVIVAVSGGAPARALGIGALYFLVAGGWGWLRLRRGNRKHGIRSRSRAGEDR